MRRSAGAARSGDHGMPKSQRPMASSTAREASDHQAQVHDLDRLVGRGMTVPAVVLFVEALPGRSGFAG